MTDPVRHPTLDELAAVDAEAVDAQRAEAVRHHASGCAACAAVLTDLRRVRAVLRSAPIPALPPRLAERIDRALELAPAPAPVGRFARPIPPRRVLAAAAAAIALVGVGAGALTVLGGPGRTGSGGRAAGSEAQPAARPLITATGQDYTAAGLGGQVQALLSRSVPGAGQPSGPRPNTLSGPSPQPLPSSSEALAGCLNAIAERQHRPVLAADVARFAGQPAIVVVLAGPVAGQVTVVVTAPGCRAGRPEIRAVFPGLPRG